MNLLITICARGGSKSIPHKNIKDLAGQPLISYTIAVAKKMQALYQADIELTTDSDTIAEIACQYGLCTEFRRPEDLSGDVIGKYEVIENILTYAEKKRSKKYDFILDLDVSSPFRSMQDLSEAFELFQKDTEAYNIFSVNPASRNPYFNMVEPRGNGYVKLVKDEVHILNRQSAPPVYDMNASFYFFRRAYWEDQVKKVINEKSLIYVMDHMCFDLDYPIDYEYMSWLIANNKLDFDLCK